MEYYGGDYLTWVVFPDLQGLETEAKQESEVQILGRAQIDHWIVKKKATQIIGNPVQILL